MRGLIAGGAKSAKREENIRRGEFMKSRVAFLFAAVVVFVLAGNANASRELIDLGPTGTTRSVAYSVNNEGQVVGWCTSSPPGTFGGCIFDSTGSGGKTYLASRGAEPFSINNSGQIVGYSWDNSNSYYYACSFDPTGSGANINLGSISGYTHSKARGNSNNGKIVGYGEATGGYHKACFFDSTGNKANIDLGTLGGNQSDAYSINNNGKIVGWAQKSTTVTRACLFDPTGKGANIELGALGSSSNFRSKAYSINNSNQIVGEAEYAQNLYDACIFNSTGNKQNLDLGTLGGTGSRAWDISDLGQIVGSAKISSGVDHACLFDPTGGKNNIDLNAFVDPASGWILTNAYSINDYGWIVGEGTKNGQQCAFLLTPEPASALFICAGLLFVRSGKRHS
jgi:probable HAF family extracellular repeat protein